MAINNKTTRTGAPFDLPAKEEGYSGGFHYTLRPLAEIDNITEEDVIKMRNWIHSLGYKTTDLQDYATYQLCKYQGKTYLLDSECAYR
ncbi:MAG: hypothetical protein WCF95_04025 [bacterium]